MPQGFVRVAAVSIPVHLGKVQDNVAEILSAMEHLREKQVQIAVFPELCLTGSTVGDLLWQPEVQEAAWNGMLAVAEKTQDMAVIVGLPVAVRGRLYNAAAVLQNGRVRGLTPQVHPSGSRWFRSGAMVHEEWELLGTKAALCAGQLFEMDGCTFAVELGSDSRLPEPPGAGLALAGAELILCPDATPAAVEAKPFAQQSLRLHAGYVYACAGMGESTGDQVYDGWTGVMENGVLLAEGPRYRLEGGMTIADVDVEALRFYRQNDAGFDQPARTETSVCRLGPSAGAALPLLRSIDPLPFVPQGENAQERLEETARRQCAGLMSRLRAIRCSQLVVGVSGGLDSTLALLVAVRSFDQLGLDRKGIHAITMPGMGTGVRTKTNADKLMEALGVTSLEIPIGPAVRQHFADIGQPEDRHDVTYENSQARERTQILMDYANKVGGIVLGTGDLSEEALGFCTYNGDHMSMYNPNASIPKTLMRRLVVHLGLHSFDAQVAAICQDVVDTPVSPELLPVTEGELSQRTEDILGDYALHDFFLYHRILSGAGREKLLLLARQAFEGVYGADKIAAQLNTFLWRFRTQQFKRSCMPDGPQATALSLSPRGGWVMPGDLQGWGE